MTNILLFARILLYTQLFESFEKLYMKKFVESIAKMEFNRKKILTVSIGIIVIGIVYYVLSRPRKAAVSEPTVRQTMSKFMENMWDAFGLSNSSKFVHG